jgi:hypothetical protein
VNWELGNEVLHYHLGLWSMDNRLTPTTCLFPMHPVRDYLTPQIIQQSGSKKSALLAKQQAGSTPETQILAYHSPLFWSLPALKQYFLLFGGPSCGNENVTFCCKLGTWQLSITPSSWLLVCEQSTDTNCLSIPNASSQGLSNPPDYPALQKQEI